MVTLGTPDLGIGDAGRSILTGVAINTAPQELNRARRGRRHGEQKPSYLTLTPGVWTLTEAAAAIPVGTRKIEICLDPHRGTLPCSIAFDDVTAPCRRRCRRLPELPVLQQPVPSSPLFFGAFGAAGDGAKVPRWSANPLGMLWPSGDESDRIRGQARSARWLSSPRGKSPLHWGSAHRMLRPD
jgi:hypothetical protein